MTAIEEHAHVVSLGRCPVCNQWVEPPAAPADDEAAFINRVRELKRLRDLRDQALAIVDGYHAAMKMLAKELGGMTPPEAWADPKVTDDGRTLWCCYHAARLHNPDRWSLGVGVASLDKDPTGPHNEEIGARCHRVWKLWDGAAIAYAEANKVFEINLRAELLL